MRPLPLVGGFFFYETPKMSRGKLGLGAMGVWGASGRIPIGPEFLILTGREPPAYS